MKQLFILFKKDITELYRTKKILILGIVFLFFAILSPISAHLLPDILEMVGQHDQNIVIIVPEPTVFDSYYQFISNFSQITIFIMIIVLAPVLIEEKMKGTFHTLLNNKVSKTNFVLAKVISQIKLVTLLYLFSIGVFLIYTYILFNGALITNWLIFFTSIYLYYVFLVCLINLISVIAKNNIMSIGISVLAFLGIMLFNFIPIIGKYQPNYLITIATKLIADNDHLRYVAINYGVTVLLSLSLIFLAIKLCNYEDAK